MKNNARVVRFTFFDGEWVKCMDNTDCSNILSIDKGVYYQITRSGFSSQEIVFIRTVDGLEIEDLFFADRFMSAESEVPQLTWLREIK